MENAQVGEEMDVLKQGVFAAYNLKRRRVIALYAACCFVLSMMMLFLDMYIYLIFCLMMATSIVFIKLARLKVDLKFAIMLEEARLEASKTEETIGRFIEGVFERSAEDNEENIGNLQARIASEQNGRQVIRRSRRRQLRWEHDGLPMTFDAHQDQRLETELDSFTEQPRVQAGQDQPQSDQMEPARTLAVRSTTARRGRNFNLPHMEIFDHGLPVEDIEQALRTHLERGLTVVLRLKSRDKPMHYRHYSGVQTSGSELQRLTQLLTCHTGLGIQPSLIATESPAYFTRPSTLIFGL